jgi:hypothetical protein
MMTDVALSNAQAFAPAFFTAFSTNRDDLYDFYATDSIFV